MVLVQDPTRYAHLVSSFSPYIYFINDELSGVLRRYSLSLFSFSVVTCSCKKKWTYLNPAGIVSFLRKLQYNPLVCNKQMCGWLEKLLTAADVQGTCSYPHRTVRLTDVQCGKNIKNPLWGHRSISIDSDLGALQPYFLVVMVTPASPFFACMQLNDTRSCWRFEKTIVM